MKQSHFSLSHYDYSFPPELIAQSPATPRDHARLLVYHRDTQQIAHEIFTHLPDHLPKGALLVFNQTKVIPARLALKKPTGGTVRILYLETTQSTFTALADRPLAPGTILTLNRAHTFEVVSRNEKEYVMRPLFPISRLPAVLEKYGTAPIPPYIKHSPLSRAALKSQYQTVFATQRGSVAAPTASLHFTKRLMRALRTRGIHTAFVTLHVGLGTFLPVTDTQLARGKLHKERYEIPRGTAQAIARAKREGRPVIAVGTTVVRTLETAARTKKLSGTTDLFIREGDTFRTVDGMITNFHVPQSSLLMLVSAFAGRKEVMSLYRMAIAQRYRLFSFGDGMLIL